MKTIRDLEEWINTLSDEDKRKPICFDDGSYLYDIDGDGCYGTRPWINDDLPPDNCITFNIVKIHSYYD